MRGHSAHHPSDFARLAETFETKFRRLVAQGKARDFETHTFTIIRPQGNLLGLITINPELPLDLED